jgi:hypothetical protein
MGSQCRPNECIFGSGKPWVSGFWVGGYMSQGREIGELVYEQPGTRWMDPVTTRRVPSKLKGTKQGSKGRKSKGDDRVHIHSRLVYIIECLQ